jgi:hypothetical protein
MDSQMRADFANAGRQRAESFTLQKMAGHYQKLYASVSQASSI